MKSKVNYILYITVAVLVVNFVDWAVPREVISATYRWFHGLPPTKDDEGVTLIPCPNGFAYRLRNDDPFAGSYIRCEDFDDFFELVSMKYMDAAEGLLLRSQKRSVTPKQLKELAQKGK